MTQYLEYPTPFGVNIVTNLSENNLYQLPRSQIAVFPFKLNEFSAIRIDAGHSTFYDNQNGTISAWPSDEINGRSITGNFNTNTSRIPLQGDGFTWLLYSLGTDITAYESVKLTQWIYPDTQYYMCFQNTENKNNGLYVKFSYLL